MDIIICQILSFFALFLFVSSLFALLKKSEDELLDVNKPFVFKTFETEIALFGRIMGRKIDALMPEQARQIRTDILVANLNVSITEIRGLQCLSGSIFGFASLFLTFVLSMHVGYACLAGFIVGLLGWYYPVIWTKKMGFAIREESSKALPYAIDLVSVSMEAGQDFTASIRQYVKEGPDGALKQKFAVMLKKMELGSSRIDALKELAHNLQLDEFNSLVTSVIQSSEMGASIASVLKLQATEIRRCRYQKAERKAAKAPSLMMIPTALFILPAVFIIIAVPIAFKAIESGIGNYTAQ